jgi:hypothetical protein
MILLRGPDMSMGTSAGPECHGGHGHVPSNGVWAVTQARRDRYYHRYGIGRECCLFDVAAGQLAGTRPEQPTTEYERSC